MIRVVAKFLLKPEEKLTARALFEELIAATRKEYGCASYDLAQSTEDENLLVVLEAWESQEALDVHGKSEHFTRIVPQLVEMCQNPPMIDSFIQII